MHRLLAETAEIEKDVPSLSKEAEGHLRVVRPRDGESVELFDGRGLLREFSYSASKRRLEARSPARRADRPYGGRLALFACVTKGSRWDWTVEKATELGASRIVPVLSARTVVRIPPEEREAKRCRWLRIAEEAARQSDAAWIPDVLAPVPFGDALRLAAETVCFAGALLDPRPAPLSAVARAEAGRRGPEVVFSVFVGPEGDFSPDEMSALLSVATPASFGPTVLRAETAAMFGVAVLAGVLQDFEDKEV